MSSFVFAVLLSLVSAVAYAAGAIVQERVAAGDRDASRGPLRDGAWWGAVLLNGAGGLLHVAALAYGPLSLVQPLGALTIVFALPMAALVARRLPGRGAGRPAGRAARRGALIATVGLAGLLALTQGSDARTLDGSYRLLLGLLTLGLVGVLCVAASMVRGRATRSVLLAAASGVAFGVSSVFIKTVTAGWSAVGPVVQAASLAAVAVLAVAGLLLSQAAYRGAGLAAPLAVVTVVNPVVATAVGLTLFGEGFRYGAAGGFVALAFGAVSTAGLVLLTRARPADGPRAGGPSDGGAPAARPAPGRSDPHAVRPQVGERVDVAPVRGPRTHLEVEMRARYVAGGS
ncbi:DMT family transporter [Streptomyces sp. 8L]|uniref:DMT family transporter n=1 Tax=Streptomyces sp. 8L TaxID=2877242 RepID=UPI001CD235F3|nr:DMT family transporter [Streptomyces sp. 8L]MCA1219511.1 DMT family transporter [Streptomyces sp. 8L]